MFLFFQMKCSNSKLFAVIGRNCQDNTNIAEPLTSKDLTFLDHSGATDQWIAVIVFLILMTLLLVLSIFLYFYSRAGKSYPMNEHTRYVARDVPQNCAQHEPERWIQKPFLFFLYHERLLIQELPGWLSGWSGGRSLIGEWVPDAVSSRPGSGGGGSLI